MTEDDVRKTAFAMPLLNPAYPKGPYRFINREFLIITYRTDLEKLKAVVPAPLKVTDPFVHYEFIRMSDSTGFGDYTESGQVIPIEYKGEKGSYTLAMYLDDHPPIAGGRELWGFPKKLANPTLKLHADTLIGTLDYGPIRIATGTMGYKHQTLEIDKQLESLKKPNYLLKMMPNTNGEGARICELVQYGYEDINLKGAWTGPASLELHPHALAPVANLPVLEIVRARHLIADVTLGLGKAVFDYLK